MGARDPRSQPFAGAASTPSVAFDLGGVVEVVAQRVAELLAERILAAPAVPLDGYLDVEGAAHYLAARPSRIYDLVQLGRLQPHRDGRRLLFTRAALDAALEAPEASP